jgi:hypothetical protein
MSFTQDDHVINALAPDRADQPFSIPILPGRGSRNRLVTNPHGAQPAFDEHAIDTVAIADQVAGRLIPRECLRYLPCDPFRGRTRRDVDPDELSSVQSNDNDGI